MMSDTGAAGSRRGPLLRSPRDNGRVLTVARWNGVFGGARPLAWDRTELLSDVVLERPK